MTKTKVICKMMVLTSLLIIIIGSFVGYIQVERKFDREVNGHIVNALHTGTPELMIYEINLTIQGIGNLGITDDMYGVYFDWDKTPNQKVGNIIKRLESIIDRAHSVIDWRDNNTNDTNEINDVYQSKMDGLKDTLGDVWGQRHQQVCRNAYIVNFHLWWYFWWVICVLLIILGMIAPATLYNK